MFGNKQTREQRLAAKQKSKAQAQAGDRDQRRAAMRAKVKARCEAIAVELRALGWTDITVTTAGPVYVVAGTGPDKQRHATNGPNSRELVERLVALGGAGDPAADAPTDNPAAAIEVPPIEATTSIELAGQTYAIAPADAPRLSAALWQVLSRRPATIELASGQVLTLTPENIDDVMGQLAGPADPEASR